MTKILRPALIVLALLGTASVASAATVAPMHHRAEAYEQNQKLASANYQNQKLDKTLQFWRAFGAGWAPVG